MLLLLARVDSDSVDSADSVVEPGSGSGSGGETAERRRRRLRLSLDLSLDLNLIQSQYGTSVHRLC